jgi:hypothetical protein
MKMVTINTEEICGVIEFAYEKKFLKKIKKTMHNCVKLVVVFF